MVSQQRSTDQMNEKDHFQTRGQFFNPVYMAQTGFYPGLTYH